jgi:hypothetical protein
MTKESDREAIKRALIERKLTSRDGTVVNAPMRDVLDVVCAATPSGRDPATIEALESVQAPSFNASLAYILHRGFEAAGSHHPAKMRDEMLEAIRALAAPVESLNTHGNLLNKRAPQAHQHPPRS